MKSPSLMHPVSKAFLMKNLLTLLLISLAIASKAQTPSNELLKAIIFNGLENKVKPGYGTKKDPIPSGAFKYLAENNKMQTQMQKLKNSYRWPNGVKLDFSKRFSTPNEAGTGILDCYTLVNPETTDTIRLFVDPYREEVTYFVPEGLTALTLPQLKKELIPYIEQIDRMNAAPDILALKESRTQILDYMYQQAGTSLFIDPDKLSAIIADKAADKELITGLAYWYMISKFYACAKDIQDPKQYAFNQMRLAFQNFSQLHPEVKTGELQFALK